MNTLDSQFLIFSCGEEDFALPIQVVKEIIGYSHPTYIPMMPKSVLGVINLRGNVLPVVDLNLRLGREKTIVTKRACILHVEVEKEKEKISIGLLIEKVNEVIELSEEEMENTPDFGLKFRNEFVKKIGKFSNRFVIILDVNAILSLEELSAVEIGATQNM